MKAVLLVSSLILGVNDGYAVAEHSQEFNNVVACTTAVEIRTGYKMERVLNGFKLTVDLSPRYGTGKTTYVCAYLGGEK